MEFAVRDFMLPQIMSVRLPRKVIPLIDSAEGELLAQATSHRNVCVYEQGSRANLPSCARLEQALPHLWSKNGQPFSFDFLSTSAQTATGLDPGYLYLEGDSQVYEDESYQSTEFWRMVVNFSRTSAKGLRFTLESPEHARIQNIDGNLVSVTYNSDVLQTTLIPQRSHETVFMALFCASRVLHADVVEPHFIAAYHQEEHYG